MIRSVVLGHLPGKGAALSSPCSVSQVRHKEVSKDLRPKPSSG